MVRSIAHPKWLIDTRLTVSQATRREGVTTLVLGGVAVRGCPKVASDPVRRSESTRHRSAMVLLCHGRAEVGEEIAG